MDESTLQLELERPSAVIRTVKGQIAWESVKEKLDEAYKELGKSINLKGFRKGKVPRPLMQRMFGKRVDKEIAHNLVQEACVEAIKRLDLKPVLPIPQWELTEGQIQDGQGLDFAATLEVLPEVEVGTWQGLEITRREAEVTDEQVEAFLRQQQQEQTQFVPVEGQAIEIGHIAACDVMGKVGDEAVSMEQLVFQVVDPEGEIPQPTPDPQKNYVIHRLSRELVGSPADPGERDLEWELDDKAPEGWQGKTAQLLVEVQAIRERRVPELDDDFARDLGEADTLDEYRTLVRQKLLEADEQQIRQEMRRAVEDALIEQNPIEVTGTLVEKQLNSVVERAKMMFQMQGVSTDALGMDDAKMRETFRKSAEKEVKKTLLTDAIARNESVEVTDDELEARITALAEAQGESLSRLKAEYEKEGHLEALRVVMREEKVLDLLLEQAHVTTKASAEAAVDAAEEPEETATRDDSTSASKQTAETSDAAADENEERQ